jgi:hypothetical protein
MVPSNRSCWEALQIIGNPRVIYIKSLISDHNRAQELLLICRGPVNLTQNALAVEVPSPVMPEIGA